MRADRLVAALLVLQARGRVTAAELSEELEISVRTARRDLEALAQAGVPVYPQRGRGGGWSLVGGARTDLSGLTAEEARALLLVAGPSAATPPVKAALRKLIRALPEPFRADADAAAAAVVVDASGWDRAARPPPPHLAAVQQATIEGRVIRLRYRAPNQETERLVHPLGLVAKRSVWYLVSDTDAGMRTFRLDRIRSVTITDEPERRPPGFNLEERWTQILAEIEDRRFGACASGRADPNLLDALRSVFGTRLTVGDRDATGWVAIELRGWSDPLLANELAGFADHVEVLAPEPVRRHLAHLGATLAETYGAPAAGPGASVAAAPRRSG
jgi:predicted DNA-binding transcriptional regulator YafY